MKELLKMWRDDVRWDNRTEREKRVIVWAGVSFAVLPLAATWWLAVPAIINLMAAVHALGGLEDDVEE